VKPTEDATIERQYARTMGSERRHSRETGGERQHPKKTDDETDRWRRAMTRRDRPGDPDRPAANADSPDLPAGWCQRRNDDGTVAFVREGGEIRLSATRENDAWRVTGHQRTGEAQHDCSIGGAPTRAEAVRCLFDAMERINAAMADSDWNARICLVEAVDGVCRRDAGMTEHLVR